MKLFFIVLPWLPTALMGGLLAILSDCQAPKKPDPKFAAFSVQPSQVCTNLGLPFVRVNWQVNDPGKKGSCVRLSVNGTILVSQDGGALPANLNQLCNKTDASWTGERGFSLTDLFGNNIPSAFTVQGSLEDDIAINAQRTTFDQKSAGGTASSCQAGNSPQP